MNFLKLKSVEGEISTFNVLEISTFRKAAGSETTIIHMKNGHTFIAKMSLKEFELLLGEAGVKIHGLPIG